MKRKNKVAAQLSKLRRPSITQPLSEEERQAASVLGKLGNRARNQALSPEQRREIARKAGQAGGRGRKKKEAAV